MIDTPSNALRVYICCAQADLSFANELLTGLTTCGFEVITSFNPASLPAPPKLEIEDRIATSDTVLFILTPDALNDSKATSELEDAYNMGKRLYLIPIKPISSGDAPEAMLQLPYVSFQGDTSFAQNLATLVAKLKTNHSWVQEHTRLSKSAIKWLNHGKAHSLLLFGRELDRAMSWRANKPQTSSHITKLQDAFINASLAAYKSKSEKKQRAGFGKFGLTLIAAGICACAYFGVSWQETKKLNFELSEKLSSTTQLNNQLEAVQTRLYADMRLAPSSNTDGVLTHISGWYPRASSHAGSVARIQFPTEQSSIPHETQYTGLIIAGELLGEAYRDKNYILTPTFNLADSPLNDGLLASNSPQAPTVNDNANFHFVANRTSERVLLAVVQPSSNESYDIQLPALHGSKQIQAMGTAWQSQLKNGDRPAFSLHQIPDTLPTGARAISISDIDCQKFTRIKSLGRAQAEDLNTQFEPIGIFSLAPTIQQNQDFSIPSNLGYATIEISNLQSETGRSHVIYKRGTITPETGAPVFNLTTGKIIALHIGESSSAENFEGVSLESLLNEVRADLSSPTSNINSICAAF